MKDVVYWLLNALAALNAVAVVVVAILGRFLPEAKRAPYGRVLLALAFVGLALALRWGAVNVREIRGGYEMLLFAIPAFAFAIAFHAVFWTGGEPGTGRNVALTILAALVLLGRLGLFFIDVLAAG